MFRGQSKQTIAGYRDALALIHESAEHMPFSESVMLLLHTLLYCYMLQAGGRWKATNNDTIERHPARRVCASSQLLRTSRPWLWPI